MICESCKTKSIYDLSCLSCCVRLVKSARPSRAQQEAMLLHIHRSNRDGVITPTRDEILTALNSSVDCAEKK